MLYPTDKYTYCVCGNKLIIYYDGIFYHTKCDKCGRTAKWKPED